MTALQLAVLKDPAYIRLPNNRLLSYQDEEWFLVDTPPEAGASQLPTMVEGEGMMFRTMDGNKWLFTPPDNIQRLPEVIYSGSVTIR